MADEPVDGRGRVFPLTGLPIPFPSVTKQSLIACRTGPVPVRRDPSPSLTGTGRSPSPPPLQFPHALSRSISFGRPCPSSLPILPPPVRVRRRQHVPGPVLVSPSRPYDRRPSHPIFSPVPCSPHPEPGQPRDKTSRTCATLALSSCAPEPPLPLTPPLRHSPRRPLPSAPTCRRPQALRPRGCPLPYSIQGLSSLLGLLPLAQSAFRGAPLALELCVLVPASSYARSHPRSQAVCTQSAAPSRTARYCRFWFLTSSTHALLPRLCPRLSRVPRDPARCTGSIPGVILYLTRAPSPLPHHRTLARTPSLRAHLRDDAAAPLVLVPTSIIRGVSVCKSLFAICLLCTVNLVFRAAYHPPAASKSPSNSNHTKRNLIAASPAVSIPIPDAFHLRARSLVWLPLLHLDAVHSSLALFFRRCR
ncbi:hypothetical protein DFH09DRAFT_1336843 [Mycena vulgaris]|nr:hypothetical protein DFH09DRAFT_1336843 [Mycena vulgaris]